MNKFGSCDTNLMNTLSIKPEIDIKEEPLENEEYVTEKVSEICTDVIPLEKSWESNFGKIKVKHEETFDKCHNSIIEENDQDVMDDIDVKNEIIDDLIEDIDHTLNKDVIRKAFETCTDVLHVKKHCESNFGKVEDNHEDILDKVHDPFVEDKDTKADIDVKNENIEDITENQSHNLNKDIFCKKNILDMKRGILNEPKRMTEKFDSSSLISSIIGDGKRNIINLKNKERKKRENKVARKLNDAILENDLVATSKRIKNGPNIISEISESSSSNTSRVGKEKSNKQKSEKRKKEENKVKDFESRKRVKIGAKFECSLCEYKTSIKGSLKLHSLVHSTTEKLFKCSECDFESNYKSNLKLHLLTHSNTKLFKCSECDYECNQKGHLKLHLLLHSNSKLFKCSECDYECNQKGQLKLHLLSHSNTKLFKCSECDYECNQKFNLKRHLLSHSKTKLFKCSECDFECNKKFNLKVHLLSHSNAKLFKCSECDYECNQKRYLILHLLSHSNTKLFKCSECDYGCNRKRDLKRHLLSHSNTKLFKCSECDYECNRKSSLKLHLLSHSIPSHPKQ